MWIFFFLLSLSYGSYMIVRVIFTYLAFDVETRIDTIYESQSQFPTITICNNNPPAVDVPLHDLIIECHFGASHCHADDFEIFNNSSNK